MKLAVFASGNGSNFEAIIQAGMSVELLISDKEEAFAVKRAKAHEIPAFVFNPKAYNLKADFEAEIVTQLQNFDVDLIVLAGYMRLIGPVLLKAYEGRIINIHPSLLPAFPGLDAVGQALKSGVKVTGVTVHFVDEGMDTGPIIAQETVKIEDEDTRESLTKKIQHVEHKLYPLTVQHVIHEFRRSV